MPQAKRSPLACSSSSPRQRRMTGARRDRKAQRRVYLTPTIIHTRPPSLQAPRQCLCLLHKCGKARPLTGGGNALHATTRLQYHITSLTTPRATRCKSADDHPPHRAFQTGRACTGGQTKGRTTKGCMQVPSAEWSLALPDMSRG